MDMSSQQHAHLISPMAKDPMRRYDHLLRTAAIGCLEKEWQRATAMLYMVDMQRAAARMLRTTAGNR